jgi:hypothetical protein
MLFTFSFSIVNSQLLSGVNAERQPSAFKNNHLFRMWRSLADSPSWHLTLSFVMRLHHHVEFHYHLPSFDDILVQVAQDCGGPILCVLYLPYFRVCLPDIVIKHICTFILTSNIHPPQLTLWCRSFFFFNFCTPCIWNVNNTGTKRGRIMK